MNRELADKIADAVLYEGYMLYPYRPSAIKNRQRWTFGTIYPPDYEEVGRGTESAGMHSECLLNTNGGAVRINVRLRFLHLLTRQLSNPVGKAVPSFEVDGSMVESWDEGISRSVEFDVSKLTQLQLRVPFHFPGHFETGPVQNEQGQRLGNMDRTQHALKGSVTCSAENICDNLWRLSIDVSNETALAGDNRNRNEALLRALLSAHLILSAQNAEFVSFLDPPEELTSVVRSCVNRGNFPVLVGDTGSRDMLLCSPIVLYDYPQIAPESAGNFFDSTEMDEMLTLRIMTLTDEEKNEMRRADPHGRDLLQRTEQSAREQLMRTHGVIRSMKAAGE